MLYHRGPDCLHTHTLLVRISVWNIIVTHYWRPVCRKQREHFIIQIMPGNSSTVWSRGWTRPPQSCSTAPFTVRHTRKHTRFSPRCKCGEGKHVWFIQFHSTAVKQWRLSPLSKATPGRLLYSVSVCGILINPLQQQQQFFFFLHLLLLK